MIQLLRGVFEAGADIIGLEVGIILKDLSFRHASGQQIEHILDADAHAPDARPPAALVGVESDAIGKLHVCHVGLRDGFGKQCFVRDFVEDSRLVMVAAQVPLLEFAYHKYAASMELRRSGFRLETANSK